MNGGLSLSTDMGAMMGNENTTMSTPPALQGTNAAPLLYNSSTIHPVMSQMDATLPQNTTIAAVGGETEDGDDDDDEFGDFESSSSVQTPALQATLGIQETAFSSPSTSLLPTTSSLSYVSYSMPIGIIAGSGDGESNLSNNGNPSMSQPQKYGSASGESTSSSLQNVGSGSITTVTANVQAQSFGQTTPAGANPTGSILDLYSTDPVSFERQTSVLTLGSMPSTMSGLHQSNFQCSSQQRCLNLHRWECRNRLYLPARVTHYQRLLLLATPWRRHTQLVQMYQLGKMKIHLVACPLRQINHQRQ